MRMSVPGIAAPVLSAPICVLAGVCEAKTSRIEVLIVARFAHSSVHPLKTVFASRQSSKAERKQCSAISRSAVSISESMYKRFRLSLKTLQKSAHVAWRFTGFVLALPAFKENNSWNTDYASCRNPLGPLVTRSVRSIQIVKQRRGVPSGRAIESDYRANLTGRERQGATGEQCRLLARGGENDLP